MYGSPHDDDPRCETAARRRTKIVATLGPASREAQVLARLVEAGMDVARINLSHGSRAEHERSIADVRAAAAGQASPLAVLIDLPGPKLRRAPHQPAREDEPHQGAHARVAGDAAGRRQRNGWRGRTRTFNPLIQSQVPCQLGHSPATLEKCTPRGRNAQPSTAPLEETCVLLRGCRSGSGGPTTTRGCPGPRAPGCAASTGTARGVRAPVWSAPRRSVDRSRCGTTARTRRGPAG